MRIALDATYALDPQPTGVARYSQRLIAALSRRGLEIALAARPHRYLALRRAYAGHRYARWLLQAPFDRLLARRATVFHGLNQRLPAARFRRTVVTVHDLFPITGERYAAPDFRRRFSEFLRDAVRRADHIVSVSEYTRGQLAERLGVEPERVTVVHHGIDPPAAFAREPSPAPLLLCVGAVQVRKNTLGAVRALELLPPEVRMVVAGGDGYGAEEVKRYVRDRGLAARVEFLGHADEATLDLLYAQASLLLFPSLEEGFGFPVLEAMARGVPVVASNASSLPEIAGQAALLADPNDAEALAGACRQVLEDSELAARLTRQGKERAAQFTWEQAAEATLRVYRRLL
jgi:alpha-1,3-rhamnosyl/mannosyltransferase